MNDAHETTGDKLELHWALHSDKRDDKWLGAQEEYKLTRGEVSGLQAVYDRYITELGKPQKPG